MDEPILRVELTGKEGGTAYYTELTLPATEYELLDTLEILHAEDDTNICFEPLEYYRFGCLAPYIQDCGSLFGLNTLTRQLARLDAIQGIAFAGLLKMEDQKQEPIRLPRMLALVASAGADCCHVINVKDDAELGRFYAENSFLPELDKLPDSVFEKLDFAKIGKEVRVEEHGEFVLPTDSGIGCYVVQDANLAPDVETPLLAPREPPCAILLEVEWEGATAQIPLPSDPQEYKRSLDSIGAKHWDEVTIHCLDCRAPTLREAVERDGNISHILPLAYRLQEMDAESLTKFKAVLTAMGISSVETAVDAAYHLDEYILETGVRTPEEAALAELRAILDDQTVGELRPFLNLYGYGEALLQKYDASLTDYGMVEIKRDGQTQALEQSPARGGMEMTM